MSKAGTWGQNAAVMAALMVLSGCLGTPAADSAATRADVPPVALEPQMQDGTTSPLISGLLDRRSVLSGPFDRVASAVLAANSRAAEADLRAAMLRSQARAKNWLPTLGPSVSLTSLGAVVTSMLVEQVIFDNGRKKAERDYAKADVEVAAVALAQDSNARVKQALHLYLTAEAARARAGVNAASMAQMDRFEYVMSERVRGGVSNMADLQVVQARAAQMRADMAADQDAARSAMAELAAMADGSLDGISGLGSFAPMSSSETPLTVMKAGAESARAVAEARAARAGYLPGLSVGGTVGSNGSDIGAQVAAPNGIGLGLGAALQAIEAEQQSAAAKVGQAQEDATRARVALEGQLATLNRQQTESQAIATQANANFEAFAAQLREGQRTVPEVVGVFETKVRAERDAVMIKYQVAGVQVDLAAALGVLVDGDKI